MGEYEPKDSRIVTQNPSATPIEPERTAPREGGTREQAKDGREPDKMTGVVDGETDDKDRWQTPNANERFEEKSASEKK